MSRIEVTPTSAKLLVADSEQFAAAGFTVNGRSVALSEIVWSSSDTAIAQVDSTGLVAGILPGGATITATSEGVGGSATVTINGFKVTGTLIDGRTFNPAQAISVSIVAGIGAGQAAVTDLYGTFTLEDLFGSVTYRVAGTGYRELSRNLVVTGDMVDELQIQQAPGSRLPCGDGPNVGNRVMPQFGPPFVGDHYLRNWLDHDQGVPPREPNGRIVNACGEMIRTPAYSDGHNAYDYGLAPGTPLIAVADGVVSIAGDTSPRECEDGSWEPERLVGVIHTPVEREQFATTYVHATRIDVHEGDTVTRGQQLGLSGRPACQPDNPGVLHFATELVTGVVDDPGSWIEVDPYGWEGDGVDPWSVHPEGTASFWLWLPGQAPSLRCCAYGG